jgi:pyruvate dehydrogenase E1 component beta subunit
MERDEAVFLVGEDVARVGGPYGVTRGLLDKFGPSRVRDTPISEALLAGLGTGAAAVGRRPVIEIMFFDFAMLAMDQIVNQAAKYRYFTGHSLPLTIRTMCGAGGPNGAQHSQNFEAWFCAVPGLKVVMPSNAADAKGLLKSSIRDEDPVLFIETQGLLTARHEVPLDEDYLVPLGSAAVRREGSDVTVVAIGRQVDRALEAAELLAAEGIAVEVIDPRTLSPLDEETIVASVEKTGALVVVDESPPRCSVASEIAAVVSERAFDFLNGPVRRVTAPHTPVPFTPTLEEAYAPSVGAIVDAVRSLG